MTVELLPHQKRALAWMLHREQADTRPLVAGGLLADDQGLGKTVTTIALLLKHPPDQVCPPVKWLCYMLEGPVTRRVGKVCHVVMRGQ